MPTPAHPGTWLRSPTGTLYLVVGAFTNADGMAKVRVLRIDRNGVVQRQALSPREWRGLVRKGERLAEAPTGTAVDEAVRRAGEEA